MQMRFAFSLPKILYAHTILCLKELYNDNVTESIGNKLVKVSDTVACSRWKRSD